MKTRSRGTDPKHQAHYHAVQFYSNDDVLCATVAGFLSEGLVAGQPAVLIAPDSHTTAILEQLTTRFIDVERARHIGDLIVLDAENTLATFMRDEEPDPVCFKRHVGEVVGQALGGRVRTPVRAYGEMVDVLWKQGKASAAIKLEMLWNELAAAQPVSLLCGYAADQFRKRNTQYQRVCAQHTHILTSEDSVLPFERRKVARGVAVS